LQIKKITFTKERVLLLNFDEVYPKEKLENTERILREFWAGKGKTVYSAYLEVPTYRQVVNRDEMIKKAIQNILLSAKLPGFNIPRFIPDFGTISTASYWGGDIFTPQGGCIGIKPIIETEVDVCKVKPSSAEEGDVEKGAELWRTISTNLKTDRLYSSFIDIQGPLNTAALIWKQDEFMMAMYTNPSAVHELLEQIIDQIIKIGKAILKRIGKMSSGPLWPYIWLPSDLGIGITEDYMPLISPKLYKEFGIPYVEKISEAFSGLFIHCCGEYEHQLENLTKSKINILGMEFDYPHTRPEIVFKAFGSSAVFVPYMSPQGLKDFPDRLDYFRYIKEKRFDYTRLWFIPYAEDESFKEQVNLIESMI
jgi:hypothetical protein